MKNTKQIDEKEVERTFFIDPYPPISKVQFDALHLWFRWMAEALNDAGLDQRVVLKKSIPIPWSEAAFKEKLWKTIQKARVNKISTKDLNTVEPDKVYKVFETSFREKFGVCLPFPTKEDVENYRKERKKLIKKRNAKAY